MVSRTPEVILGEQDTLIKADNYDRFSIDQIVSLVEKDGSRRFEKLIRDEGRLRTDQEIFEKDTYQNLILYDD